ncbi:MAG: hypothetical protein NTW29_14280 [Bacteroidetes bacterium]|nr:hypothetical protein [Bacteroidota bacterium]
MSKKQLYFLGGAVLLFLFITRFIPIYVLVKAEIFLTLVIAGGVGFCIYQVLKPDEKKMYTPENYEAGKSRMSLAIICAVLAAITTLIITIFNSGGREADYIKAHSVIAEGVVTSGKAKTTKRRGSSSTSYTLDVTFVVDGKNYNTTVDVDGSEWSDAGIGMPVMVSYAKGHPGMCRILFNGEQVRKYSQAGNINHITLDQFINTLRQKDEDKLKMLKKQAPGWTLQGDDDGMSVCYHSVYKTSILGNEDRTFLMETGTAENFSTLLDEARKKMTVVYDSMSTNPIRGVVFKKDSLQIRFQQYTKLESTTTGGEFQIPIMKHLNVYVVGATKEDGLLIMPGDLAPDPNDPVTQREMRQKAIQGSLERLKEQQY